MDGISVEAIQRMEALVRQMADINITSFPGGSFMSDAQLMHAPLHHYVEAKAIVKLLPAPVDPDIAEAREIFARQCEADQCQAGYISHVRNGSYDDTERGLKAVLAAIKRGRELAGQSNAG